MNCIFLCFTILIVFLICLGNCQPAINGNNSNEKCFNLQCIDWSHFYGLRDNVLFYFVFLLAESQQQLCHQYSWLISHQNEKPSKFDQSIWSNSQLEVWYNVLIGFISNVFNPSSLREVAPFFKTFEFILVPIVQIYTSPPIKRFIASRKGTTLRSWNALLHNWNLRVQNLF